MIPRGTIRAEQFARQLRDYAGLRWDNITPTDIDGFIDFKNRLFVFMEFKCGDAEIPRGQRVALERLVDRLHGDDFGAILFVGRHDTGVPAEPDCYVCGRMADLPPIDAAHTTVTEYRWKGHWREFPKTLTMREAIEQIRSFVLLP